MATYKVLQDIEAEDKLIGPLTLKQFIFAIITLVLIFIAFMLSKINIVLSIPWIIPVAFFGFMASPIGRDQPNDVWLAARLRFLIKPRKRKWDQSGMTDLVTITVPKKLDIQRTNGLDQIQVSSRLKALSTTLDSRGWAIKNINVNLSAEPSDFQTANNFSDRLVDITTTQEVPDTEIRADDDILDPMNNMVASRFDTAIKQQRVDHISKLKDQVQHKELPQEAPQDYSFITQPPVDPGYTTFGSQVVAPATKPASSDSYLEQPNGTMTPAEADFLKRIHANKERDKELARNGHDKVIAPLERKDSRQTQQVTTNTSTVSKAPDDILKKLGQSADELKISSLASLAKHAEDKASMQDDQVISLH